MLFDGFFDIICGKLIVGRADSSLGPQKGLIMAEEEAKKLEEVEVTTEVTETPAEEVKTEETTEVPVEEKFAKAGKKSKKHVEEVKAEEERQARKAERAVTENAPKPKGAVPVTRPVIERRGKKYQDAAKMIEKNKTYALKDAIELALKTSPVKFDASLEAHVRLGVDPRQADQNSHYFGTSKW